MDSILATIYLTTSKKAMVLDNIANSTMFGNNHNFSSLYFWRHTLQIFLHTEAHFYRYFLSSTIYTHNPRREKLL